MNKLLVLTLALLVNISAHAYEPEWKKLNKTFSVKGGVGIEQFVKAIGCINDADLNPENVDKKNGYFSLFEEGDGHFRMDACYWNRSDGKKLFVVSYDICETYVDAAFEDVTSQWGFCNIENITDDRGDVYDTGCMAYLYDDAKRQLVPMKDLPFAGLDLNCRKHYLLELPQQGKDIVVRERVTQEVRVDHTLKWNGKAFDFVKSKTSLINFYCHVETDDQTVNVRNAPNGKVVDRLTPSSGSYNMFIDRIENGWCHICGDIVYEMAVDEDRILEGSPDDYWVHNSQVAASGMGAGGVTLRLNPDAKAKVVFESDTYTVIHPVEIRGEWVKVYVDKTKTQGWMLISDICSNPLTVCC